MMQIEWTSKALMDLARLYDFLAPLNLPAAARVIQNLTQSPVKLLANPRIGEKLDEFLPREVRRILIGAYELRYEIHADTLYVLRVWHTREQR
ncbi:type II toxin-antitoxin system RelE/ParE family toxin [Cellvibrio sp. pealriver]|uniref:type II toxin-antitoxin system RelE/ParE family toxin n=1 Tax=Cellvibrio sp. pealriver TaxID=1622269 RepID=UPI00066FF148|nr:type II toxin-antitoxin system RelE/ParE family toxin [Cellvibrio sp. pealriver]